MKPLRHLNGFAVGDLVQLKAQFRDQRPVMVHRVLTSTLILRQPRAGHYLWSQDDVEIVKSGMLVPDAWDAE